MSVYSFYRPLEEAVEQIEERAPGYREALLACAKHVLQHEEAHRHRQTTIKKDITDECEKVVDYLIRSRSAS